MACKIYFYIKGFNMVNYLQKMLSFSQFTFSFSWFITLWQYILVITVINTSNITMKEISKCFLPLTEETMHLNNHKVEIINVLMKKDRDSKITLLKLITLEDKVSELVEKLYQSQCHRFINAIFKWLKFS